MGLGLRRSRAEPGAGGHGAGLSRADGSAWPPLRFGRASLRLVAGASLGASAVVAPQLLNCPGGLLRCANADITCTTCCRRARGGRSGLQRCHWRASGGGGHGVATRVRRSAGGVGGVADVADEPGRRAGARHLPDRTGRGHPGAPDRVGDADLGRRARRVHHERARPARGGGRSGEHLERVPLLHGRSRRRRLPEPHRPLHAERQLAHQPGRGLRQHPVASRQPQRR